jgi:hypothetical protein
VTYIGNGAFYGCYGLTSVTIPNSVTSIGNGAFRYCIHLTSVTIGNSVTSIGDQAFQDCSALTSVTIPNSVITIGYEAFDGCGELTSATIGNSVTSIGDVAFRGCSCLSSVTIGNSVTYIGEQAFYGCMGMTSITIPESVTSIGASAFNGIDLTSVISRIENPNMIKGKEESFYKTFSMNTFNNATLYVPAGTIDKYKGTEGWRDFVFIEEGSGPNSIARVRTLPVMIQNEGSQLKVSGLDDGTQVGVYHINGSQAGSAVSHNGSAVINTTLQPGSVAIVKACEKSFKVVIR